MHEENPPSDISGDRATLLTWLRLMRLPTVFTALSNILCGFFVTAKERRLSEIVARPELWLLLLSSAGLYLGGMVLNDVFDAALDKKERPERPIPSGKISRRAAGIFGTTLLIVGLVAAFTAGMVSSTGYLAFQIACILAAAVILYDAVLKSTILGPVGMAACRFLNVTLGAGCAAAGTKIWAGPHFDVALGLFVYILGVTWFARNEAGDADSDEASTSSSRSGLFAGVVVALAGIGIHLFVMYKNAAQHPPAKGALIALALIAGNIGWRCANAIRANQPVILQKTVGFMLLNIIFIDAAMTFGWTGSAQLASLVVILVIPATLMKRIIPMS